MIVRDADGSNPRVVPDGFRRTFSQSQTSPKVSIEKVDEVIKQKAFPHPGRVPKGSTLTGASNYGFAKDDTCLTYDEMLKLRKLFLQNPLAYSYCKDPANEAIYSPRGLRIARQPWQSTNAGAQAVEGWMRLFEARPNQSSLMELCIGAAFYFRLFGEVLAEVRYVKNDYLGKIGYPDNKMVGNIDLISPLLLQEVEYEGNRIKSLTLPTNAGYSDRIEGEDLKRFIFFHNQPANERRGVSRLRPLRPWMAQFDDLLELTLLMYELDARPIEEHIMNEDGLTPEEVNQMWVDHKARIKEAIDTKQRAIMHSNRIELKLLGMNNRALDASTILNQTKSYIHQGSRQPEAQIEPKNANKATIEVQQAHYQASQLEAVDRHTAQKFTSQNIFRMVLESRGMPALLTPMVDFVPFTMANDLEQAMAWETEVATFGPSRKVQIAEQQGFEYDMKMVDDGKSDEDEDKRTTRATLLNNVLRG